MICASCKYLDTDDYSNGKYWCSYHRTYVWPTDEACSHFWEDRYRTTREIERLTSSSSGACIITMACKKALGVLFTDTCDELETIRGARELLRSARQSDILEYYQKSPAIVSGINSYTDKDERFLNVYMCLVKPLVELIKHGDFIKGYSVYRSEIDKLIGHYCG